MPSDGIWRKTATPVAVQGHGLAVMLRSSDVLVPSWGGEILLRMDAIAPVAAFPQAAASVRPAERLVIVIDGAGPDTAALANVALDNLGGTDRAGIIDAMHARPVLPLLPGAHHTLLRAAVERLLAQTDHARSQQVGARSGGGAGAGARLDHGGAARGPRRSHLAPRPRAHRRRGSRARWGSPRGGAARAGGRRHRGPRGDHRSRRRLRPRRLRRRPGRGRRFAGRSPRHHRSRAASARRRGARRRHPLHLGGARARAHDRGLRRRHLARPLRRQPRARPGLRGRGPHRGGPHRPPALGPGRAARAHRHRQATATSAAAAPRPRRPRSAAATPTTWRRSRGRGTAT